MGTDRFVCHRRPCPCGLGELTVAWEEPDHLYPTRSGSWVLRVECEDCVREFDLVSQGGAAILVRREDVERRCRLRREAEDLDRAIVESAEPLQLRRKLESLLNEQPSMAAAHRLLQGAGLDDLSMNRFRERVRDCGYREFVDEDLSIWAERLSALAAVVGVDVLHLEPRLEVLRGLQDESGKPYEPVGDPIFEFNR